MKLLFFTYDFPYPANSGGKMRAYNLIKFAKEDIEIILFSFIRRGFDEKYTEEIKKLGVKKIRLFKRRELKKPGNVLSILNPKTSIFKKLYFDKEIYKELLKTVIDEKIDVVHFESFYTSFYINSELKKNGARLVMGEENIEYEIYKDYAKHLSSVFLKPFYYSQSWKIKKEEQQFWKNSDCCIAVLNEEAELIKRVSGKNCFVVENGVDLDYFKFKERESTSPVKILFVGNFTYFPNLDAVKFFYNEVYKVYPNKNLDFTVIGKNSTKLKFLEGENVHKIEYVSDLREYYYGSDIFIFPVRFGGGTNFKILEAFGCGLPVVAYPSRIKGLGAQNEKQILLASNGEKFHSQIERLIKEKELAAKLAISARLFVEKNYDWTIIGKKLNRIWKEI